MPLATSRPLTRHQREVLRGDRRWLLAWIGVFAGTLLVLFVAHAIYRATGPHPQITVFVRALKHHARWFIPGLKRKPNARDGEVRLETDELRYAAVDLPRR